MLTEKVENRMILSLLLFLLLSQFLPVVADNGNGYIKGRVYDKQTLESLPSANIIYGGNKGTVTDKYGFYSIKTSSGNVRLTFKYIGYETLISSVEVSADDTVFFDAGLEPDIAEINQIVISAGKVEQRVAELTVSMHIIKPEAISSSHISGAVELMNRTPGIEVLDGQASIRGGSGFSYGAGSRVLALIDGLPVLAADAGNIKWQFLPLENISQIEIIKGASSVLYGSSALNGIVNFRTADAGDEPVTTFFIETGLFDSPQEKKWKWWDSPRISSSTSFSHMQRFGNTGLSVGMYLLNDNGYRKLNYERLGRLNMKLKHDSRGVKGLSYGFSLNAGRTRKIDFILWEDASQGALKQQESTANELRGTLLTLDPWISLEGDDRFRHNIRTRFQLSDNAFPGAGFNNSRALSFLAEYQFFYSIFPWIDLNFGIIENYGHIVSEFYGDHNALNLAGYTQLDITPAERLKIVGGLRMEYNFLDGEGDGPTPLFRTGVNYRVHDYTFFRASFGQGYRYPSIAEKHAATTLGSVRIIPNPSILPESGWSSEIGVKQGIVAGDYNGQLDLALFYSQNIDMIEYLFGIHPVQGDGSYSFGFRADNVEHSRVYGGEFEFSMTGTTGIFQNTLTGGYSFMYPVEFDQKTGKNRDVKLKYRRKHSFKMILNSSYDRYDFGFIFHAASRMLNIDDVFLNEFTREDILPGFYEYWNTSNRGYILTDPHLGYAINNNFKLSFVVKNVFNTQYMGRPGDIMPHRNFSLRLSGKF